MVHFPAAATPVPTTVVPSYRVTVLLASAVPVKTGVVMLVMLSVLDLPVSDAAVISGADGATGAIVSIVTDRADDTTLTLPATSVAVAEMLWTPFAKDDVVTMVHVPPVTTPEPIAVAPSNRVTVLPASAVPVNVGVTTLVMLSVLDAPLSEAASRSGVVGAAGGT